MFNLDALIDTAVVDAQIASGIKLNSIMARARSNGVSERMAMVRVSGSSAAAGNHRSAVWSPDEDAFLRKNLGHLPVDEIARELGRSPVAVKIRWTRMGYEAPSKRTGEVVATVVGRRLGACGKRIIRLIDMGILPGRVVPGRRNIHVVRETDLRRWITRPQNWIYFKVERITDPHLKRLVEAAQARWDDEWWRPGQVAAYHGVTSHAVNKAILLGKLPAVRWDNWRILKSDAIVARFENGKGNNTTIDWSPAGDAFMIVARGVGLPCKFIDRLRDEPKSRSEFRLRTMMKRGLVPLMIKRFGLRVEYDHENGRLWADWREYADRFPGLTKSVGKFLSGDGRMSQLDRTCVRGVLWSWVTWRAETPEQKQMAQRLKYSQSASLVYLREAYRIILSWGIGDPLGNALSGDES